MAEDGNTKATKHRLMEVYPHLPDSFASVIDEACILHAKKNADYGSDGDPHRNVRDSQDWGVAPWVGAMIRMEDKARRLKTFVRKGELRNESVRDSLIDRVVYAAIALALYEEDGHLPLVDDENKETPHPHLTRAPESSCTTRRLGYQLRTTGAVRSGIFDEPSWTEP